MNTGGSRAVATESKATPNDVIASIVTSTIARKVGPRLAAFTLVEIIATPA